jgi:PTH1 family peptidyl-tRNA hydrolase
MFDPLIKLIVGLGNPGVNYQCNRHNIGFMALECLAQSLKCSTWHKKFSGEYSDSSFMGHKIVLLKPLNYMNLSGHSVVACANFYKIKPEEILVIYDELDLMHGRIKIKQGGSNGGHNGIKSIEAFIGKNFYRMRIGISHPGDKAQVSNYVLSNFSKTESLRNEKTFTSICLNAEHLLTGKFDLFMNNVALINNVIA